MYTVDRFGNGFTVFFDGDEVFFDTYTDAKAFAEEMEKIAMQKEER